MHPSGVQTVWALGWVGLIVPFGFWTCCISSWEDVLFSVLSHSSHMDIPFMLFLAVLCIHMCTTILRASLTTFHDHAVRHLIYA